MEPRRNNWVIIQWKNIKSITKSMHFELDEIFYHIGLSIGRKPWLWLLASFLLSSVCGPGMLLWREEIDEVKLFIPSDSIVRKDAEWVKEHFKDDLTYESIIVTAPNILEPEILQAISEIEESVKSIVVKNQTWHDVCAGYLTWIQAHTSTMNEEDLGFAAGIIEKLNTTSSEDKCIYQSLLKLWKTKKERNFNELSKTKLLEDVSKALNDNSSNGNLLMDVGPLLANIEYDELNNSKVIRAQATILNWITKKSNEYLPEWELEFIERVLNSNRTLPKGMQVYAVTSRSFNDVLRQVLKNNMTVLFCGLFLIAIYVMTMIGRCNVVQQRIYLSLMGVSVVGQAILSAYGVCYYMGYFYGPLHAILPFLLLGIGVDDMFVVTQSIENLSINDRSQEIPFRIGKALKQSGMSITVTSVTNMIAFGIGITTVMPFLESFCVFATMGILFLYIYEIIFFVSCLVLDERRLTLNKDGCFCRVKVDWKPNDCSQRSIQRMIFEKFLGPLIMRPRVKILVLLITAVVLTLNAWAIFQVEQNFDPLWYLNQKSYPIKYHNKLTKYFPKYGKRAAIYLSGVDYYDDRRNLVKLVETLKKNPYVNNQTLEPWFMAYDEWLDKMGFEVENEDEYYGYLSEFLLLDKRGQSFVADIKFNRVPMADYNITISKIQIQHILINTTTDQMRAMQSIRNILDNANFTQKIEHYAVYTQDYVSWTANQIIGEELVHNLCLEIFAVGIVTLLILRNIRSSIWVICCVLFTLIDLLGSMYYLGLTIEISSSIMILLCAGLAVDYAAHIGLEFTRAEGTKNGIKARVLSSTIALDLELWFIFDASKQISLQRAISTLGVIGPAIFNGGLSTFLAFVLLSASDAYLFITFFKLFSSVVVFGLFHGLIFLPVILSLLGPIEKKKKKKETTKENCNREQNDFTTVHLPPICPELTTKPELANS